MNKQETDVKTKITCWKPSLITGPIRCAVVISKHIQMFSSSNSNLPYKVRKNNILYNAHRLLGTSSAQTGYLGNIRQKVVWDSLRIFTNLSWDVSTNGIEVPEQHSIPVLRDIWSVTHLPHRHKSVITERSTTFSAVHWSLIISSMKYLVLP